MAKKDAKLCEFEEPTDPELVSKLVSGNTIFAMDVYQELRKKTGTGNIFFSPMSISVALAMTYLGAANNTATEMKQTLKLTDLSDEDLHEAYKDINQFLQSDGQAYKLKTVNRIFATYKFHEDFLNATKKYYSAEAKLLDFKHKARQSRAIKDLLPRGLLNSQTAMVLVNAIYFKGDWKENFDSKATRDGKFKLGSGGTADIQMMFQKKKKLYGKNEELDCEILEIPYVSKDLSMFIILPNKDMGLPELEKKINAETLSTLISNMGNFEVEVHLPRFKLEHSFSVKVILQTLGMKDTFTKRVADFSKMDGTKKLYVSDVVHKAFIEVNEERSEAAAADTGVEARFLGYRPGKKFKADHPFLFFVREHHSKSILFMGRLTDPRYTVASSLSHTSDNPMCIML